MPDHTMTPVRDAVRTFNKYLLNPAMLVWPAASIGTPQ